LKTKPKKILLLVGILSAFGLLVFYSPIFLGWLTHDIPPIGDSDLLPSKISISEQDNGYFELIKALANFKSNETILQNQAALDHFHAAMQRPAFQDPAFSNPETISFETRSLVNLVSIMDLSKLEKLYLLSLTKRGLHHEAITQSLQLIALGQKIQDSLTNLLFYVVGNNLKQQGISVIQQIILSVSIPPESLRGYIQALEPFHANESGLISVMKFEYTLFKNLFQKPENTIEQNALIKNDPLFRQIEIGYYFRPNKTLQMKAKNTRELIKKISLPCGNVSNTSAPTRTSRLRMYFTENMIGKTMIEMVSLNLVQHIEKRCEENWHLAATQSLMAIQAYKLEKGNYPKTLEELSPTYLPHPPIDPYDGQPLKYDLEKKIIYSASQNKNLKYSFAQL